MQNGFETPLLFGNEKIKKQLKNCEIFLKST